MNFDLKNFLAAVIITVGASAHAQTVPVAKCAATGPGALICASVVVTVHELVQAGNGKQPFGPNGEGMKVVNGAGDVLASVFGWDGGSRPPLSKAERDQNRSNKWLK